ncbi:glycosyltransferase [Eubacterium sp.]
MKKEDIYISVIIPVYNQKQQLLTTLAKFDEQTYPKELFEVIVVDDGSNDIEAEDIEMFQNLLFNVEVIRQENKGRAIARNNGIRHANGDYIIFCDADRFPNQQFIKIFVEKIKQNDNNVAYIGNPKDFFGQLTNANDSNYCFKYSRESQYYRKISNIFSEDGTTNSGIAWAAFLVGNSCVSKKCLDEIGGFNELFNEWGFEHFELAFRMLQNGVKICNVPNNINFHIPHSHNKNFYIDSMHKSVKIMNKAHKDYDFNSLIDYMVGKISLQEFERIFSGSSGSIVCDKDIFFNL